MTQTERTDVLDTVTDSVLEVELPPYVSMSLRTQLATLVRREVARRLPPIPQPES